MPPTLIQQIFLRLVPRRWAESMVAESRAWHARCPCGYSRSIWDLGGIRWRAAGNPKRKLNCPECGQQTWHTVAKDVLDHQEDVSP